MNQQSFKLNFTDHLRGLQVGLQGTYHRNSDKKTSMKYWHKNLNKTYIYHEFWVSPDNEILFNIDEGEDNIYLGGSTLELIQFEAQTVMSIFKAQKVEGRIFGIPSKFGDIIDKFIKVKIKF